MAPRIRARTDLARRLRESGISEAELAREAGVGRNTVGRLVAGVGRRLPVVLAAIEAALARLLPPKVPPKHSPRESLSGRPRGVLPSEKS